MLTGDLKIAFDEVFHPSNIKVPRINCHHNNFSVVLFEFFLIENGRLEYVKRSCLWQSNDMNNYNINEMMAMEKYLMIYQLRPVKIALWHIKKWSGQPRTVDDSQPRTVDDRLLL